MTYAIRFVSRVMSPSVALPLGLPVRSSVNQRRAWLSVAVRSSTVTSVLGQCVMSLMRVVPLSTQTGLRQPPCFLNPGSSQPVWRSEWL